ncbi:MAG: helix-turn-helix transcriptional regulator [Verrucomicrobiota bacterium]
MKPLKEATYPINLSERPRIVWAGVDTYEHMLGNPFKLGNIWTLHLYEYSARIRLGEEDHPFSAGSIGICEPYSRIEYHSCWAGEGRHFAFNFQVPDVRGDAIWEIPRFTRAEVLQGQHYESGIHRAITACNEFPFRAEIELWSILLNLAHPPDSQKQRDERSLDQRRIDRACSMIDLGLDKPIYAQRIADELQISVTHVGRLFKKYLDCPVATYIRRKRAQRAHELLVFSSVSISDIAVRVGIPDLGNFNRLIRTTYGLSPRKVRDLKPGLQVVEGLD